MKNKKKKYAVTAIIFISNSSMNANECIKDLTKQTLYEKGELQLIIINDSTKHNYLHYFIKNNKLSQNIVYIKNKIPKQKFKSWNLACKIAKGEFITTVNTEFRNKIDSLERLENLLKENHKIDVAYSNYFITDYPNSTFYSAPISGCFLLPQYDRSELFKIFFIGPQPMWRKSIHKQFGYFDGNLKSAGDYDFWLRLASAGVHFQHIPECLGLYLMSEEGMEHSDANLSIQESELARSRHWKQEWGIRPTPGGTYLVPMQLVRSKWQTERPDKPLVSVIIPTKDRPAMLCDAVRSALTQTYPHIEVVVINDAGCDVRNDLATIPDSSKITYVNLLQNSERSKCRNCGITIARGNYITYLDDDDIFYPNHIETLILALQSSTYDVAYSDSLMAQQSLQNNNYTTIKKICFYSHDFNFEKLLVDNYIPILCLMHKKSCINKSGYFDNKISTHEDWDLWIRLAQHYDFMHIKKITSEYRVRDDNTNTTNSKLPQFLESYRYIYKKYPLQQTANEFTHLDRKKTEFAINLRAYSFICELITKINFPTQSEDLKYNRIMLERCGAPQYRIMSATFYIQSKFENNAKLQRILLHKSIKTDPENYLAWLSLCNNYLNNDEFDHVEKILQLLIEANPLEISLYDSLISILKVLNKNRQAENILLIKERILILKNINSKN